MSGLDVLVWPPTGGTFQTTSYAYDRLDRLTTTDPAGSVWTNTYDKRGRKVVATDPDKGTTALTYDDADQLTTSTDARGVALSYGYGSLGRRTGVFDGTTTSGFRRAAWVYDNVAKGNLTSSTRYANATDAYTRTVTGYNDQYQPLGTSYSLPTVTGQPTGTFTVSTGYHVDGSVASTTFPAAGGLAAETVTRTYDTTGNLLTLGGIDPYVTGSTYHAFGPLLEQILGAGTKRVRRTTTLDEATRRLVSSKTETQNQTDTANWDEQLTEAYGYDDAGNVKTIKETAGGATVANQCFGYDGLRRLTEAWTTAATACQTAPAQAAVGGSGPYWSTYAYNATGTRSSDVTHAAGGDTSRGYTYPATGQRHTLTSATTTGAATGTDSYTYDATGNLLTRSVAGAASQTLTWDSEGHLATVTASGATASYVYDADGNRLLAKDPSGATAYLDGFELRTTTSGTTATRFLRGR